MSPELPEELSSTAGVKNYNRSYVPICQIKCPFLQLPNGTKVLHFHAVYATKLACTNNKA